MPALLTSTPSPLSPANAATSRSSGAISSGRVRSAPNADRAAARGLDLGHHFGRRRRIRAVVHGHRGAGLGQPEAGGAPDAARSSGDERGAPGETEERFERLHRAILSQRVQRSRPTRTEETTWRILRTRSRKLQAAEDIRHLKARYARVCDTGYKPEGMAPLFTKDAVWDGGRFGRYEGIDAICGFFDGVSADIVWALHYMIAPVIEVARRPRQRERHLVPLAALHRRRAGRARRPSGSRAATPTATARRTAPGSSAEVLLDVQTIAPYEDGWVRRPFWND